MADGGALKFRSHATLSDAVRSSGHVLRCCITVTGEVLKKEACSDWEEVWTRANCCIWQQ